MTSQIEMENTPKISTICPYCGVGCGLYLKMENGRVIGLDYFEEHPINRGSLCAKANAIVDIIHHRERLNHPLKKKDGGWLEISWDEALDIVASRLKETVDKCGSDAIGFIASAKCTNEENYLLLKLARLLGTNNIDSCARLCHAPTLSVLMQTLGSGAVTNPIADLADSKCIFIIGSNFAENHPIVSRYVLDARENGANIIVADPRFTPTAWMSDIFLQLKPGTDTALINGLIHIIMKENLINQDFISKRTVGFDELAQIIDDYTPEKTSEITGVKRESLKQAARLYAKSEASALIFCMGITQHTQGSNNVAGLVNLALICGQVAKQGAGLYPLRGQNNVQGACDMGTLPDLLPGYISVVNDIERKKFAEQWGVKDLPSIPGLTLIEMVNAAENNELKSLYVVGEDIIRSNPNSGAVYNALKKLDFLVVQDIFLTDTAKLADIILPGACWAEKEGTFTNTERRVQWINMAIKPIGEAMSDWEIITRIGHILGFNFNYSSVDEVLSEINTIVPAYRGITSDRIKNRVGGLFWPCPSIEHPGTPILYTDVFNTPTGKATIMPVEYYPPTEMTNEEYPLILTTGRMGLHYNAGSLSLRTRNLKKRSPELYIEIHPADAEDQNISNDDQVIIITQRGEITAKAIITTNILPGVVFVPFHFPGVNILTTDAMDSRSKIPEFKVTTCKVVKK